MTNPAQKSSPDQSPECTGRTQADYELYARVRRKAAENAKMSKAEWLRLQTKHAKEIMERTMERAKFRQLHENGNVGYYDQDLIYYLEGVHARKIRAPSMPEFGNDPKKDPTAADFLAFRFLKAVFENDPKAIRNMATAVKRVQARASGSGKAFKIAPGNLKKSQLAARARIEGPPTTVRETAQWVAAAGLRNADQKDLRRIHKGLGGRTGRVGRPKNR